MELSSIVLQQLDDAAGDVSGLAVKCLAPLVKKITEAIVVEMTGRLFEKLPNGKDQHRDIASIALKTIIAEISTIYLARSVLVPLTPLLINGMTSPCSCLSCYCQLKLVLLEEDAVSVIKGVLGIRACGAQPGCPKCRRACNQHPSPPSDILLLPATSSSSSDLLLLPAESLVSPPLPGNDSSFFAHFLYTPAFLLRYRHMGGVEDYGLLVPDCA
ncbi:hypothetical protein MLD38_013364 [Melastoma candidum]|uniref:Uncharacterized protein n=1 Tax=Melastoma candidum TaxID=119954 RepID=A0ACB9RHS8_9MYRT|nr:hypothetical protein MLD38_013364 [Melastoma candidum]